MLILVPGEIAFKLSKVRFKALEGAKTCSLKVYGLDSVRLLHEDIDNCEKSNVTIQNLGRNMQTYHSDSFATTVN